MRVEIEIPDGDPEFSAYVVRHLLQGLALGCRPLFVGPSALPPLYKSGVRFAEEPTHGSGVERFRLPSEVFDQMFGDCDGLTVYRLAEELAKGSPVAATIGDFEGSGAMHAQVRWKDSGRIEDPAILLGSPTDWPHWFLYDKQEKTR